MVPPHLYVWICECDLARKISSRAMKSLKNFQKYRLSGSILVRIAGEEAREWSPNNNCGWL